MAERGQSEQHHRSGQEKPGSASSTNEREETSRTRDESSQNERGSSERKGTANRGFAAMDREKQKKDSERRRPCGTQARGGA